MLNNNNPPLFTGKDIGVSRNGVWSLDYNYDGTTDVLFRYGITGDIPVAGDWNGDGTLDAGVFRSGKFYVKNSNTNGALQGALVRSIGEENYYEDIRS